jgi:hypothetical protein
LQEIRNYVVKKNIFRSVSQMYPQIHAEFKNSVFAPLREIKTYVKPMISMDLCGEKKYFSQRFADVSADSRRV